MSFARFEAQTNGFLACAGEASRHVSDRCAPTTPIELLQCRRAPIRTLRGRHQCFICRSANSRSRIPRQRGGLEFWELSRGMPIPGGSEVPSVYGAR